MNTYFKNGLVLCFFALLTGFFTWPLCSNAGDGFTSIPGGIGDDALLNVWNIYTFKTNIQEGHSPFMVDDVFAPLGADLTMHGYMPAMCMFAFLFDNNILAMNVYLVLHFILSAFGAYLLAQSILKNTLGSLFVGIAFGFSAYKLVRLEGHYMLVLSASIPFYILCFLNAFEFREGFFVPVVKSLKYIVFCALLGLFTAFNDYYATFYLIYFSLAWACYYKVVYYWGKWNWKKRLIYAVLFFEGMHLIIQALRLSGIDDRGGFYWGADVLSFLIPNSNSWLYDRDFFVNIFKGVPNGIEYEVFLGLSGIACVVYLVIMFFKKATPLNAGPWIFVLVVLFMIALPAIKINGFKLIHSPTAIIHFVPFFNNIRCNTRIEILITLVLSLLAAWTWASSIRKEDTAFKKYVLPLGLILFMLLDLRPDPYFIAKEKSIPAIYSVVKEQKGTTLTNIPIGLRDGTAELGKYDPMNQFCQTYHRKNISGGYISRVPISTFEFFSKDSVMNTLLNLSKDSTLEYSIPTEQEKNNYFSSFRPDMFLLDARFRNTRLEQYLNELIRNKKYKNIEQDGYRLVVLE